MCMRPSYLFSSREIIPTFALHLVFGVKLPIWSQHMAWHFIFSKNPWGAKKNLGKILMSKFLLNFLIKFLKVLPNSKNPWNLKINFHSKSQPKHPWRILQNTLSLLGCAFCLTHLLSPLSLTRRPRLSDPPPSPILLELGRAATSPRCSRPPCTTGLRSSRCHLSS
jgi:hypothetical protein